MKMKLPTYFFVANLLTSKNGLVLKLFVGEDGIAYCVGWLDETGVVSYEKAEYSGDSLTKAFEVFEALKNE